MEKLLHFVPLEGYTPYIMVCILFHLSTLTNLFLLLLKEKDAEVVEFARFEKGEGIEKKEENFAEEVMKQLQ